MSKPHFDREHHVKKATGVGDPQCFKGEAGKAKFKVGDRVRVKAHHDVHPGRRMHHRRARL